MKRTADLINKAKYPVLVILSVLLSLVFFFLAWFLLCFWTGCQLDDTAGIVFLLLGIYFFIFTGYLFFAWVNEKKFVLNEPLLLVGTIILIITSAVVGYYSTIIIK